MTTGPGATLPGGANAGRSRLGLGTVQWGTSYGIANQTGVPPSASVGALLDAGRRSGIRVLDTSPAYGDAERVLGGHPLDGFDVVTKSQRFDAAAITPAHAEALKATFHESLRRLNRSSVHGLLVHHVDDVLAPGGERLIGAMQELQSEGLVEAIGVSVYTGSQIDAVLDRFAPQVVQLPVSVLDQRLVASGHIARLAAMGVAIHARSVFLQGLLLMPVGRVPSYFAPIRPLLERWHAAAQAKGLTAAQAALSFVRHLPEIDTVLVGVDTLAQLHECLEDWVKPVRFDAMGLQCDDPAFVNPGAWRA